jgi:hypothetical protein
MGIFQTIKSNQAHDRDQSRFFVFKKKKCEANHKMRKKTQENLDEKLECTGEGKRREGI